MHVKRSHMLHFILINYYEQKRYFFTSENLAKKYADICLKEFATSSQEQKKALAHFLFNLRQILTEKYLVVNSSCLGGCFIGYVHF